MRALPRFGALAVPALLASLLVHAPATAALPDLGPPAVAAQLPTVNALAVSQTADVVVTFTQPLLAVSSNNVTLRREDTSIVPSVVRNDLATRRVTLDPVAPLAADTRYRVTLNDGRGMIRTRSRHALPRRSWWFTTGPAPSVTSRSPLPDATNLALDVDVKVLFSERVAGVDQLGFTLRGPDGWDRPAVVTYDTGWHHATLDPMTDLAPNTRYTVTLQHVMDHVTNPMPTTQWSFTTGPG